MSHFFRRLFLTLAIIVTSFISKAQQPTTPIAFNDTLAAINATLFEYGSQWGRAFNEAYKSGQYARLTPHRERLGKFINEKLEYVLTLKDVNNSKPLRLALIEFLSYEKQLLQDAFLPFESLKPNVTEEEVKKLISNLSTLAAKEKDMLAMVADAQEKYGAENGFNIKN